MEEDWWRVGAPQKYLEENLEFHFPRTFHPKSRRNLRNQISYLLPTVFNQQLKYFISMTGLIFRSAEGQSLIMQVPGSRNEIAPKYCRSYSNVRARSCAILPIDANDGSSLVFGWRVDNVDAVYKREQCIGSSAFGKVRFCKGKINPSYYGYTSLLL